MCVDVVIRRATERDAEALADLAELTFPLACPPYHTPQNIAAHLAELLSEEDFEDYATDDDYDLFVAVGGGRILGFALLDTLACDDEEVEPLLAGAHPSIELSKLYVHPKAHGTGVAQQLFDACDESACDRSATSLWLTVWMENERALGFYRRNGFEVVGDRYYQVGDLLDHDYVAVKVFSKGD